MIISDLNYLEVVSEETSVVGGIDNRYAKTYLKFDEKVNIHKNIKSYGSAKGNVAFAEADADAYGKDTLAQSLSYTVTDPYYSGASATSVSVTDG